MREIVSMDSPTSADNQARGFALYVGLDEDAAAAAGMSLADLVHVLKDRVTQSAPGAKTHATIALAPRGTPGDDLELVRLALHDPGKLRALAEQHQPQNEPDGVVIDISRKKVVLGGVVATLTFLEFELLQFLVLREGQSVARQAIINHLWGLESGDAPNERTIDVYVRRLRQKLEPYPDIVRTVRGQGYRFDRHADVTIVFGQGPSPDVGV
jgi:DNA-binding winged helix-turn-helix (wHTH) protein